MKSQYFKIEDRIIELLGQGRYFFFNGLALCEALEIERIDLFKALEALKEKNLIQVEYRIKHSSGCNTLISKVI